MPAAKERTGRQERAQRKLKKALRSQDPRRLAAIEEARRERELLDRRLARETEAPVLEPTVGALYAQERRSHDDLPDLPIGGEVVGEVAPPPPKVARDALGHNGWTRADARSMLRQGYNVAHVVQLTGVGVDHLVDMKLDEDGYGLAPEDW